jgi:asparagine synthase (glutamine-hydrolysing)
VDNDKYFVPNAFQPNSDGHYIRLMQQELQTDHHWCMLAPEELADALEEATIARDLPGMADVDFSLLVFCKQIRKQVTVALSGECADEIFGGYPWFRDPEVAPESGFPWAQNSLQRISLLSPGIRERLDAAEFIHSRYEQTCRESDILPEASREERRMKEMVNPNFHWFMQTLLDRKDRMSMYSGLEVRVPFCDYRIAEYLYGVPWEMKDYRGREKGLLRKAVEGLLPEEVLYRKKSPYPKTFDPAYESMMERKLREILDNGNAPVHHMVRGEVLREILEGEQKWPWYGQLMRRPQTIAYFLQMDFWLKHYRVKLRF